jgi:Uroporphyrinogen-III decarboxylase
MQNSKQLVVNAIEFGTPDRLPVIFDSLGISDVHFVGWNQKGSGDLTLRESYDEWGCGWMRTDLHNMGIVTEHPLFDWNLLDKYHWPDPNNPQLYEGMDIQLEKSEGKYILTSIFMLLFERMHSLRGFENTLMDLYMEREKIELLADRIVDFNIAVIKNISALYPERIQGLMFSDDWGTESSTFISPKLWREFFKPRYQKIFSACKDAGWHIWMHSCGKINEIIPDLIEIGLDVLSPLQPCVLGIKEIGEKFAGKICFLSLCDIQSTLPYKGEAEICDEAKLLIDKWGTDKGGFILIDYGDGEAIGVPFEKKRIMFEAFKKYDRWVR